MAAITENAERVYSDDGTQRQYYVKASIAIYQRGITYIDVATGYATDTSNAGANVCAGIATEGYDNSAFIVATTDKVLTVAWAQIEKLFLTAATEADRGKLVYANNNNDLTLVAAGASKVGRIAEYLGGTAVEVFVFGINLS